MQENELKRWTKEEWRIPPQQSAESVYHMDDLLEVYQHLENVRFPLICFDETPVHE
jgi:hypothetical protein